MGYDDQRTWRHLYGAWWRRARLRFLAKHPLCARCAELGRVTPATVVDHKIPHKGDVALFRDDGNWQSLCEHHHNSWKKHIELGKVQCGADGYPKDGSW